MRHVLAIMMLVAFSDALADPHSPAPRLLKTQDLPIAVEPEALQRQYDALQAMHLETLEYSRLGSVETISGYTGIVLAPQIAGLNAGDSGEEILQVLRDMLLATGKETLRVTEHEALIYGVESSPRVVKLSQTIGGIPVISGIVAVVYDVSTRAVSRVVASFVPDRGLEKMSRISARQAEHAVATALARAKEAATTDVEALEGTHLAYYASPSEPTPPKLIWVVRVQLAGGMHWLYYVNATTGLVVDRRPETLSLTRSVYNANSTSPSLPSGLPAPMTSAQINSDPWAYEAYFDVGEADAILRSRLPLSSGKFPFSTRQVVRYAHPFPNATHTTINGIDYLTYSPPGGSTHSATSSPDITYHEYAHGIGKRTFGYDGDSLLNEFGALHESFSDIAASTVDVAIRGVPASASWRIAEGFYVITGAPMRSMANPAGDSFPYPSNDWYPLRALGASSAHFNSTILSHAYYLAIHGGLNAGWAQPYIPEIMVTALDSVVSVAEERARQIFVGAFDDPSMLAAPTFLKLKSAAMSRASGLYGPAAATTIQAAFEAVGVGYQCTAAPTTVPVVNILDHYCAGQFDITWPPIFGVNRYIAQVTQPVQGWAFATTVTDGNVTECSLQTAANLHYRIRACNNCGCGPWSAAHVLKYWVPCL